MSTTILDARMDFRLSSQTKELIEQAAALTGQTLSDFAISTLAERARQVIQQESVRVLSRRDAERFLTLLDETEPNEALRKAAERCQANHAQLDD
jgi:uncharacterized protein (DUF1778 family)